MVGWKAAGFSLALPALCLINAVGFHILPSIRASTPNPGVFTATLLYVPIGIWAYIAAAHDHRLAFGAFLLSVVIGALLMASAIAILLAGQRYGYADDETAARPSSPPPIPHG
jgi:hypothetical protein